MLLLALLSWCISASWSHEDAIRVDRPRGVSLERKPLYNPSKDFMCLDGSRTIPFEWVNDDYCDCRDGSDEPGTAACPNGSFHCANLGHLPLNIPSSRVNDQICDCCDGSDEYSGWVHCPNTCEEMGRKMREEMRLQEERQTNGYQIRQKMAIDGKKRKVEKQKLIEELKKQKDELTPMLQELLAAKEEAERLENEAKTREESAWAEQRAAKEKEERLNKMVAAFHELDTNNDGKVSVEEIQARKEFDLNADGEISPEEVKQIMGENTQVDVEDFSASVWDKIEGKFVSQVPKVEEPTSTTPPEPLPPSPVGETAANSEEKYEVGDKSKPGEDKSDDFDTPDHLSDENHDEGSESDEMAPPDAPAKVESEAITEPHHVYSEETRRLIEEANEARMKHSDVQSKIRRLEADLKEAEEYMKINFGPNDEFAPLYQQCFEIALSEYVYKLCLFEKATQRSKDTSMETALGSWGKWITIGEDGFYKMLYEHGAQCWNGPERSTTVDLVCGLENALVASSEPSRCQYAFTFATPAVCDLPTHKNHYEGEL